MEENNVIKAELIRDEQGEVVGAKTSQFGTLMISHWSEEVLGEFNNVSFNLPSPGDLHLKFVPETPSLRRNGDIYLLPEYWRRGVFVSGTLVTRTFRHEDKEQTKNISPGETYSGKVIVKKSTNLKTGEVRLILEHVIIPSMPTNKRVKIGGKGAGALFEIEIPGSIEESKIFITSL